MQKDYLKLFLLSATVAVLSGCGAPQTADAVLTETPAPTEATVLTNTPVPTVTEVPTPTLTLAPTETPVPTATSTPTPSPTPVPHVHIWIAKETVPTCAEDGLFWEECDCGEVQNKVIVPALGHRKCSYRVITEATLQEEGSYETTCEVCGAVVSSGAVPKLTPTPTPTPSPTPRPTPTPKPTATPTPSPTPVVIITPTPTPIHGAVLEEYEEDGKIVIIYEDGFCTKISPRTAGIAVSSRYYMPNSRHSEVVWFKNNYMEDEWLSQELLLKYEFLAMHDEMQYYYMYYHYDVVTETLTSRLVNSDGSFNRYSGNVFQGYASHSGGRYGYENGKPYLKYLSFGTCDEDELIIKPDELIYYKQGEEIRLYDY